MTLYEILKLVPIGSSILDTKSGDLLLVGDSCLVWPESGVEAWMLREWLLSDEWVWSSGPAIPILVTLADVAAKAGVSSMTASRILNDKNAGRYRTRVAVMDAVKALGYVHKPKPRRHSTVGGTQQ